MAFEGYTGKNRIYNILSGSSISEEVSMLPISEDFRATSGTVFKKIVFQCRHPLTTISEAPYTPPNTQN